MINELKKENDQRNLTSTITVLTHTPSTTRAVQCQGLILFGDQVDDLDGSGGDFEFTVTIGGYTIQPPAQIITFSTEVRAGVYIKPFVVPENMAVIFRVKSPNAGDNDVDVTAYLYQVESDGKVIKGQRNKRGIIKDGLVWYSILYDDDGTTELTRRAVKDLNGDDISDFEAGRLTQELAAS